MTQTTHTMTPALKNAATAALALVNAHEATQNKLDAYRFVTNNAGKTPTGRINKQSKAAIARAEGEWRKAQEDERQSEAAFNKANYEAILEAAPAVRQATLAAIAERFGSKDVTRLWEAASDRYDAYRKREVDPAKNGYKNGAIVVLDVTPDHPAFKNVATYRPYGNLGADKLSHDDVHCHLWFYIDETGKISRVKLFSGKVDKQDAERPGSGYLDDGFGIDLERGTNSVSVSTCNGTTTEIRAWGATLMLASECIEKLQDLFNPRRTCESVDLAKKLIA